MIQGVDDRSEMTIEPEMDGAPVGDGVSEPGVTFIPLPPRPYLPVAFQGVRLDLPSQFPIVELQEFDPPHRRLAIPVGMAEGIAISHAQRQSETPRPLTHALIITILESFSLEVVTLRITDVADGNYSGELVVSGPDGQRTIPCRVSDGIALCLRQRPVVPITVSPSVMSHSGASN